MGNFKSSLIDGQLKVTNGITGALNGNASSATKATQDSDGNKINATYLKLAGGTITGNISYNMNSSTQIPFKVYGGDNNGQGISVGAGGATIVGSGESAKACESLLTATTEETWITSDNAIKFYTNCQTIGNKVGVFLNSSRAFYPDTDNTGSLGTSTNKWNNIYSNNLTIQNKTSATVTYADKQNPRINFLNVNGDQAVSLIFTDYDTYKIPYGLTLVGNGQSTTNGGAYLKVEGNIQASTMTATTFTGALSGNASSATKATQDGNGNTISSTYLKLAGGTMTGDLTRKVNEIDASLSNNNISSSIYPTTFNILDKSNRIINRIECIPKSSGNIDSYWYVRNYKTDGTMVAQKGITMSMNKSGTLTYNIADPSNFRDAINIKAMSASSYASSSSSLPNGSLVAVW